MELSRLVEAVGNVRITPKKTDKIRLLADVLRETRDRDTELAAFYLTGALRQGKIGIGWSVIQKAMTEAPHSGERLTLLDVDRTVDAIAMAQGSGSTERRVGLLAGLF